MPARISQGNRFRDATVGPSAIQPKGEQMTFYHGKGRYALPAAMTEAQIADAINGFAESAERAIEVAGFDAIEIHGANGYLLDQFLTDYANTRTDRWGGATENRVRLILETFKAVRAKVGAKTPVGVRISQGKVNDYQSQVGRCGARRGNHLRQPRRCRRGLHPCDRVRGVEARISPGRPIIDAPRQALRTQSAIFANGSLHNIEQAVAALDDGADIVTIARGALANPDLPKRLSDRRHPQRLRSGDPGSYRQHQGH